MLENIKKAWNSSVGLQRFVFFILGGVTFLVLLTLGRVLSVSF